MKNHLALNISLAVGLIVSMAVSSMVSFMKECDAVRGSVVRLHIIANSDAPSDQLLKLKVRDSILQSESAILDGVDDKAGAIAILEAKLPEIEAIAQQTVTDNGYDYPVKASLQNMFFYTTNYSGFTMPAGVYDALRIQIGSAAGKNWWCVMFPPLCLSAANAPADANGQIFSMGKGYTMKFAIVEWIEKIIIDKQKVPVYNNSN